MVQQPAADTAAIGSDETPVCCLEVQADSDAGPPERHLRSKDCAIINEFRHDEVGGKVHADAMTTSTI